MDYVTSFSEEKQRATFPEEYLNRNISDVLAHLHHWHLLFMQWYEVGMNGQKPDMPAKGYSWKTLPDLNREIWRNYKDIGLEEAKKMLASSFESMQQIITKHTEEELFTKKKYGWTGTTSLAAYLISATSSHYDWAYKLIKKCT